jgi:hypothetical protein
MIELYQILNIVGVVISLVATYVLYNANARFLKGDFKKFSDCVVVISFFFLYHMVLSLFTVKSHYFGINMETIQAFNMVFGIIIAIFFIICAAILHKFSMRYGLADRLKKQDPKR